MSSILLAVIPVIILIIAYRIYSPRVARWMGLDENAPTPAVELHDGHDYVAAQHWTVLFGHHFASIAGAAPIIGPVIACLYWGWLPAVLWLLIGSIFMGAVHDFASLVLSLKNKGVSIATVTEHVLGRPAKIAFSLFVFLVLILVVAVFAAVAGKTLASTPAVVIPTFGLVLVAMLIGVMMYRLKLNLLLCSLTGVAMLFGLIVLGYHFPVTLPVADPVRWWTVILLIYGLIASVTPVTLLLQPRDHLAAAVLFAGIVFGFIGLLMTHPSIKAPAFNSWSSVQGSLWPMLFVVIACGAISGFHSLVASGTTAKQLPTMKDARLIGYGSMLTETALSILAVVAVTAGLYWKSGPAGCYVYQDVFKAGGWIKAFGAGYGEITKSLLGGFGMLIGITMLKTFIMTTLDSATRITRYMADELFGHTFGIAVFRNKYISTLLVGVLAGWLALGNWKAVWPVFGAANQLVACLVLMVISVYLMVRKRKYLFVAIPAVLMFVSTIGALIYQINKFFTAEQPKIMLGCVAITLIVMAGYLVVTGVKAVRQVKQG